MSINLDAAANTSPTVAVIDAIIEALNSGAANPSSAHELGARSRAILSRARDSVMSLVTGAHEDGVVFTSGCTEANNTVINSGAGGTVLASAVEHPSVLRALERISSAGSATHLLPVDRNGTIDLVKLRRLVDASAGPLLVSVQIANSETGVIQPIAAIAEILAERPDTTFHCDAAQAFGKITIDLAKGRGPDVITLSGHKLHAPMGVGAIVTAERGVNLLPLLVGGEQEGGMRAGTEAIPLIAGMAAACEMRADAISNNVAYMTALRDRLEAGLAAAVPDLVINGVGGPRLPNIVSVRFPGIDGMSLVAQLDSRGVAVSQGSACSSRRPEPSHVLTAMGLTELEAFETIRLSLSPLNTSAEVDTAIEIITTSVNYLRSVAWARA